MRFAIFTWADPEGAGGLDPPEKSQNIGLLSNTGPDPLENHKAIKPAFNVLGHHRLANETPFKLVGGAIMARF